MSESIPAVEERQGKAPGGAEFLNLATLIENHVKTIRELGSQIKQAREMYSDSFTNNPTYQEHDKKVKEASKLKASIKANIAKQPSVAQLEQKLKDLKFDKREQEATLSDLLFDYKEQTGVTQLELFGSETFHLLQSIRLVKAR